MKYELMDRPRIAKAHFGFRRMHVDVDTGGIELDEKHIGGKSLVMQNVLVRLTYRVREQTIAHVAPVHVHVLRIATRRSARRRAYEAAQAQRSSRLVEG